MAGSSALFGPDGTELPDPLPVLPDPLTGPERGASWELSTLPAPPPPPPAPDVSAMREAISAVLAEDPSASAGQVRPRAAVPHRPPVAITHRPPATAPARALPPELRRRIDRNFPTRTQAPRSGAGGRGGCVLVLLIMGVVAVNLLLGLVESLSALLR
ncbi:MAG TPA: hypothetical protein VFQ77_08105 [Pseudonocardiaceae bacterium]|jgi:hypothetical protein|nr:hypothetical protein [Pseudonocardiaceae bacterium]